MTPIAQCAADAISIEIGGTTLALHTDDTDFRILLQSRYPGFLRSAQAADFEFEVELLEPQDAPAGESDLRVSIGPNQWTIQRSDLYAVWNADRSQGEMRLQRTPYAIDSLLRILHTLILAQRGGFLVHAASAIRDRQAYVFSGVSGAGKTTISRLAPQDVTLLTDEISYLRSSAMGFTAWGTPFAGEMARVGENVNATLQTFFFLHKGPTNRIDDMRPGEALPLLMRNILFFSNHPDLVERVFDSAQRLLQNVAVCRLTFTPDQRVWELIGNGSQNGRNIHCA